ncbi:MAG: ABC transporter ATP-binding protein [Verrucomicrobia bacterium]|nr:ABC transporter ATP-binding protein [Verrucomicrobiota bacterium]
MNESILELPETLAEPSNPGTSPVLQLKTISLSFGGVRALADIDLAIASGEIRAIIGPNGAGKSSLLNVITGIYQPDHGQIWIGDQCFSCVPTQRLARLGVARTFQNLALFKGLDVLDNVLLGRIADRKATFLEQLTGLGRAKREQSQATERASALLDLFDLTPHTNRSVNSLSYGLQKRVELARALVGDPKILLLDEPLAGMAAGEKQEMTRFIRAARDEIGTTIILIEHDIGVVMGLSDKIAVLDYGRKIADGTPVEIRADQAVIDAYLGVAHDEVQPS